MAAGDGGGAAIPANTATTRPASAGKTKANRQRPRKPSMRLTPELHSLLSAATSAAHSFLLRHDLRLLPSQTLTLESQLHSLSDLLSSSLRSPNPKIPIAPSPPLLLPQPPPETQNCWFHRLLSSATDDDPRWVRFFRMSKPSLSILVNLLGPSLQHISPPVDPLHALAAALYRLAHAAPYSAVARRFGLRSSADACRTFFAVLRALIDKLGSLLEFYSDLDRVIVGFGSDSLPNCCGVLGFGRFGVDGGASGRNGSLLVQALVDSEGRFLDVSAGWPSMLKPDSILQKTRLFSSIEESRELLSGPSFKLGDGNLIPQYLLGDACLPLLPWLLTPYSNQSSNDGSSNAGEFNSAHARAMGLVYSAFTRLRTHWQLLSRPWKEECIDFFPFAVLAGCLLNNFLIKCGESLSDEDSGNSVNDELPIYEGEESEKGGTVRDALAGHLARVSLSR